MRFILGILFLALPLLLVSRTDCDCDSTLSFMYKSWDKVRNMSYHSFKEERNMGVYEKAEFDFVVQRNPFKVAGVMSEKRHRLLYDPQQRKHDALYISHGFPFTNMWLDINGGLFRGMNHYTISNAGCEFIFGIIRNEYDKMPEKFRCREILRKGRKEIELVAETDDFHLSNYEAEPGENVLDISKKFHVMAYALIEYNEGIESYLDDCGGKTIKVPSHYGSKVRLVVDAKHGMPTVIEVEDKIGLLERYLYSNYVFNVNLPEGYFTEEHLDGLN